ncbi:uncharacterized protein LOC123320921 isoform X2 [Coccinella septempunctata]|uniref:uncharacterized protein LOC123320921 isoform X2 n=1 Tax=Coccinella septempunctata TaxID=41139 RepID=UPI001D08F66D|nr:uncharacterized protein LOC123320921 isoform X2 [Coccinella septempunctata]
MGNSHGHNGSSKHKSSSQSSTDSTSRKSFSKSISVTDIQDKHFTNFESVTKLAKILSNKTLAEEHVSGITLNVFTKYLFPRYQVLALKLFNYFQKLSKSNKDYLDTHAFTEQCAKYLQVLDDSTMSDILVKMFSIENQDNNNETITPDLLKMLLMSSYHISMDHYSEGPQSCYFLHQTLKAIVDSCFHVKNSLSTSYVSHWLQSNCPRLLQPVHRFIVHTLATAYRTLQEKNEIDLVTGLELATPVLEKTSPFAGNSTSLANGKNTPPYTLNMSLSWLLASALPPLYSMPQKANSPEGSSNGLSSMVFLSKMLSSIPSHWVLIYDSNQHGLGANRFLHHTLAYKGPTLVMLKTKEESVFCVACPDEWHESHQYWGREESALYQLLPKFSLMEKGPKMLYLNFTARGYPHGLRVGSNPRSPVISIDGGFEKIEYSKIPDKLLRVEVWGCGDSVSRDRQLEVKKWEVREAEKQRVVKLSAADWIDHPDRYLLELAGRPQYATK